MFAAEDDVATTIRPRVMAAGGDCDLVHVVKDERLNAAKIDGYCQAGDVRLVIVDPMTAFCNPKDAWSTPRVREILRPLIDCAERHGFALVGIVHTNRWSDSTDPLDKIAEAQGFPQVARSVMVMREDDTDPDVRVLASAKNNLVREATSLAFRIEERRVSEDLTAPYLKPLGESFVTASELMGDRDGTRPPATYGRRSRMARAGSVILRPRPALVASVRSDCERRPGA
jgi:hypothetical protein